MDPQRLGREVTFDVKRVARVVAERARLGGVFEPGRDLAVKSTSSEARFRFAVEHLGGSTEFTLLQSLAAQLEHTALRR